MKKLIIASLLACACVPAISNAAIVNVDTVEGTAVAVNPNDIALEIIGNNVPVASSMTTLFTIKVTNNGAQAQLVDVDATADYKENNAWKIKNPNGELIATQTYVGKGGWSGMGSAKNNGGSVSSSQTTIAGNDYGTLIVKGIPSIPGNYVFKATLSAVTN